jgi:hypothetical protein
MRERIEIEHDRDVKMMNIKLTLRPGQRGTKRLMAQYGDRLLCVRYRYDALRQKRLKTVELIIEETDWTRKPGKRAWNSMVSVRIDVAERMLQRRVKAVGGKWNAVKKVWELPYGNVVELGLQDRICSSGSDVAL